MVSSNVLVLVAAVFIMCAASKHVALESSMKEAKTAPDNCKLIPKFFNSLDKAFKYFEEEFEQVNLDAIFGLRVSEGK